MYVDSQTLALVIADRQIYTVLRLSSLVPSLSVLLYASLSLQGHQTSTPPPAFRLMLPTLLASVIGLYLFTPSRQPTDMLLLFLPLLAMMSLRGGQDGQGEAEAWELGVSLTCLACARYVRWCALCRLLASIGSVGS